MHDHIRESNLIEGINDQNEDKLSLYAWHWLEKQNKISLPTMLELHRLITCNQLPAEDAGHFRTVPVTAGGYYPPNGILLTGGMYAWGMDLLEHWETLDPKEMHIRFEKIHPFIDGNGRTGRMLMWWHEKKLGREPTLIRSNEADRHYYYQWFK